MVKIDIDTEVFAYLQRCAKPLVDTPNDVLRRLLLNGADSGGRIIPESPRAEPAQGIEHVRALVDADAFVQEFLNFNFGRGFQRRSPYRMMFEGENALIYFQNFNKETTHLWYRVTKNPWKELRGSGKVAWIVLTNPAEGYGFVIPVADVRERAERVGWTRNYLEVNIDPASSRWSELNWDLSKYKKAIRG